MPKTPSFFWRLAGGSSLAELREKSSVPSLVPPISMFSDGEAAAGDVAVDAAVASSIATVTLRTAMLISELSTGITGIES